MSAHREGRIVEFEEAEARTAAGGDLVWHYTNLDTLAAILSSGHLLATEVSFLNDILETTSADSTFASVLKELESARKYRNFARHVGNVLDAYDTGFLAGETVEEHLLASTRFIFCASEDGDSLYAWRTYGAGGISCAIGLDPTVPLGVLTPTLAGFESHEWTPVLYEEAHSRSMAENDLRELGDLWNAEFSAENTQETAESFDIAFTRVPDARSRLRARAKNASFQEEREQRVTIVPQNLAAVSTRSSAMGPRPHLRLVAAETWGAPVRESMTRPNLPIRAVRLGPNAPQSSTEGLKWLMLTNGYPLNAAGVEVEDAFGPGRSDFRAIEWASTVFLSRSHHQYRVT